MLVWRSIVVAYSILFGILSWAFLEFKVKEELRLLDLKDMAINTTEARNRSILLEVELVEWLESVDIVPQVPDTFFNSKIIVVDSIINATDIVEELAVLKMNLEILFRVLCESSLEFQVKRDTAIKRRGFMAPVVQLTSSGSTSARIGYTQVVRPLLDVVIQGAVAFSNHVRASRIAVTSAAFILRDAVKPKDWDTVKLSTAPLHQTLAEDRVFHFLHYLQSDFNGALLALKAQAIWTEEVLRLLTAFQEELNMKQGIEGVERLTEVVCMLPSPFTLSD